MKAIHNLFVPLICKRLLFVTTNILKIESNSQHYLVESKQHLVVCDYKYTKNWKQFTTSWGGGCHFLGLFVTTNILKIESNSQLHNDELC